MIGHFVLMAQHTKDRLSTATVVLGAQGSNVGNYLDIHSFKKYNSRQAAVQSEQIPLCMSLAKTQEAI